MKTILITIFFITICSVSANATTFGNTSVEQSVATNSTPESHVEGDSEIPPEAEQAPQTKKPSDSIESQSQEVPNNMTDSPAVVTPPVTDPEMTIAPPVVDPEMTVNPEHLPDHLGQESKELPKVPH
ncbi:MAG: hypothetical protein NPIRA04_20550 [Nitrospirales bacterium]|nr:MAG: hypothetical protein NPIRA04_20550 [Nitrospirales bacterium]